MNKQQLLTKYWGFSSFKPLQEDIITSILEGNDTLALLPTGGGKSLCYQLPALLMEGTALVISPLIALMEDQVKSLEDRGIKAMYFESHPKSLPLSQQIDNCIYGNYKVVYTSPERLTNDLFLQQISQAPLSLIAVDEAHCISEWGHDFRPAYRKINKIRSIFPSLPVLALTASATPKVVQDIQSELEFKEPKVFRQSFKRPNLAYKIWKTEDKYNTAAQIVRHQKGSSIIYCNTRRQTEQLAYFFNQSGLSSDFFHGGLSADDKKKKLIDWQNGSIQHITATTAFSMGIDKADVRTLVHMQLPESIEHYYQETGRAGRDGKTANAYLLFYEGDPQELKNQFLNYIPTNQELTATYKDLCNFFQIAYGEGVDQVYVLDFDRFCERYKRNRRKTLNCLEQFDREGILSLNTIKEKYIRMEAKCSSTQATAFIGQQTTDAKVLEFLMRKYPYFFTESTLVDPSKVCTTLTLSKDRFYAALESLQQLGYLRYSVPSAHFYIIPQTPREDQYTLKPVLQNAKILFEQKKVKIDAMISFTLNMKSCKRNLILSYFGDTVQGVCEKCSSPSCRQELDSEQDFENKLTRLLKAQPHSIQELKQKLYFEPLALQIVLENLLNDQKIKQNQSQKYYWTHD
ncbi:RecQ family ATP-dependent DNA helicase [Flavobacteriaceae bacterium]|nr:RecQ family ATP-dependent DNA helicase [Flavobacteriaceae bacterium]